jgi:hypothetical protein
MKRKKTDGSKNLIMKIYLYFFMGVGLILMSFGTFGLGQNLYKSKLLPKYPLGGYEARCEYLETQPRLVDDQGREIKATEEEQTEKRKQLDTCLANVEAERSTKQVTDFYNSLILISIGLILFAGHLVVNVRVAPRE